VGGIKSVALRLAQSEKRRAGRDRRRVQVRYGLEQARHLGYTTDFCEKGLYLQANQLFPPETILQLEVSLPEGSKAIRGVVRWVKEVPFELRRVLRGGMGIEVIPDGRIVGK